MAPPVVYMIVSSAILVVGVLLGASITYAATHNRKPIQLPNVGEAAKRALANLAYPKSKYELDESEDPTKRRTS